MNKQKAKFLILKGNFGVLLVHKWNTKNLVIKQVDEAQISTIKRWQLQGWCFEHWPFVRVNDEHLFTLKTSASFYIIWSSDVSDIKLLIST